MLLHKGNCSLYTLNCKTNKIDGMSKNVFQSVLTKSILGNYGLRLQRVSNAVLVDSPDSEDVLIALDEPGHINDAVDQLL